MAASEGVKAADVCLRILDYVAFAPEPAGVTQIAEAAGIAKSAAFKHLQTLMDHGLVAQDAATARYRLGPKAWLIGRQARSLDDVAGIALPFMLAARNESGLAVVLSTPMPASAYVVLTCPSTHQIEIGVRTGSHLALHASAQGKVFLAYGPPKLLENLRAAPLAAITPHTITGFARLEREIAGVRAQGFAAAPQESLLGVNAVAAPIVNYENRVIGSIGFVGSVQHIPVEPEPMLVSRLLRLTKEISAALGSAGRGIS